MKLYGKKLEQGKTRKLAFLKNERGKKNNMKLKIEAITKKSQAKKQTLVNKVFIHNFDRSLEYCMLCVLRQMFFDPIFW